MRELCNIGDTVLTDTKLDIRIESADAIATRQFGGVVPAEAEDATRLENLITASNAKAAQFICAGIVGDDNRARVQEYRDMFMELVGAANGTLERQHRPTVRVTGGQTPGARGFGQ